MSERTDREGGTDQEQRDILHRLLPEGWSEILDQELELLELEGLIKPDLLRKSISDRVKLLKLRAEAQPANGLETHAQTAIDWAETELKKQQADWKTEREGLQAQKAEIEARVAAREAEIAAALESLQDVLNQLKALPQEQQKAKKRYEDLDKEWQAAEGSMQTLKDYARKAAQEWLDVLEGEDYYADLNAAIEQAFDDLQKAHDRKVALVVGDGSEQSLQDVQVEIKAIDKKLAYLEQHWDTLKLRLLEQRAQARP
jgi:hypothetical protein